MAHSSTIRPFKALVVAAVCAGSLDMAAAMSKFVLTTGRNPLNVPVYIASGVFGKGAFSGGTAMSLWGLLFHYLFAFLFASFFFWLASQWASLTRHLLLAGVLYGLVVWSIMNLLVVPASRAPKLPFRPLDAGVETCILILCMGLPISFLAAWSFRHRLDAVR